MKYFILINQQVLSETELDIVDGAILDYIYFYCNSQNEKVKKQRITDEDGEIWTWVDYNSLLKDMPMLKIKTIGAITPRINKIEKEDYIKTKRFQHMKKYFRMTEKSDGLFIQTREAIHIDEQGYSSKRIAPIHINEPIKNKQYNKDKKIKTSSKEEGSKLPVEYGNHLINLLIEELKSFNGTTGLDGTIKWNRICAKHISEKIRREFISRSGKEPKDEHIVMSFRMILSKADEFHHDKMTGFSYINNNFYKIAKSSVNTKMGVIRTEDVILDSEEGGVVKL